MTFVRSGFPRHMRECVALGESQATESLPTRFCQDRLTDDRMAGEPYLMMNDEPTGSKTSDDYAKSPMVVRVRDLFLPPVQALVRDLAAQNSDRTFNVYFGTVGSQTVYKGYDIGIECLSNGDAGQLLALLEIGLCFVPEDSRIMAEVSWEANGQPERVCFRGICGSNTDWPKATDAAIDELRAELPQFLQAFVAAVERSLGH